MNDRFPSQIRLPQDFHCMWEPETALFKPTEIISLFQVYYIVMIQYQNDFWTEPKRSWLSRHLQPPFWLLNVIMPRFNHSYTEYFIKKFCLSLSLSLFTCCTQCKPISLPPLVQKLFVDHGGVFLDYHCVTDILPGDCVTIRTNKGDFSARKVIITAGGWAPKLLKKLGVDLPLKVW